MQAGTGQCEGRVAARQFPVVALVMGTVGEESNVSECPNFSVLLARGGSCAEKNIRSRTGSTLSPSPRFIVWEPTGAWLLLPVGPRSSEAWEEDSGGGRCKELSYSEDIANAGLPSRSRSKREPQGSMSRVRIIVVHQNMMFIEKAMPTCMLTRRARTG